MEYLGLTLFGIALLGGTWWLTRLMSRTTRNEESTHGGGIDRVPPELP